jgi:hypothetical protein
MLHLYGELEMVMSGAQKVFAKQPRLQGMYVWVRDDMMQHLQANEPQKGQDYNQGSDPADT